MNTSLKNILLATDGSRDAEVALRAAADISKRSGAALHVIHDWTDVRPPANPGLVLDDYSRCLEKEAAKLLRQQAWKARVSGGRTVRVYLREGEPVEEIVSLAEELEADLVVAGNRGAGRVKRLITGSVSEGVVRRASCPVLIVRGGEGAWPIERAVAGDDGSRSARRAGQLVAEIADLYGAKVVLVRAYENPPAPLGGWSAEDRRELDEARLQNLSTLEGWAEQLGAMVRDRPDTKMLESKPAPAIVDAAGEAKESQTLIAVGSRGLSTPKRAVSGSVSTKVLRTGDNPILVVPPARAQRVDRMPQEATSAQRTWRNG